MDCCVLIPQTLFELSMVCSINAKKNTLLGKLVFELNPFNITDLVDDLMKEYKKLSSLKNISLRISNASDFKDGKIVIGDKKRVSQVITNIVSNALQYSVHKAKIETHFVEEQNLLHFSISVCDNGIAIAKERLQNIFTPYFIGREFDPNYPQRRGLGIFISNEITGLFKHENQKNIIYSM